jgi:hypothetical protein
MPIAVAGLKKKKKKKGRLRRAVSKPVKRVRGKAGKAKAGKSSD